MKFTITLFTWVNLNYYDPKKFCVKKLKTNCSDNENSHIKFLQFYVLFLIEIIVFSVHFGHLVYLSSWSWVIWLCRWRHRTFRVTQDVAGPLLLPLYAWSLYVTFITTVHRVSSSSSHRPVVHEADRIKSLFFLS